MTKNSIQKTSNASAKDSGPIQQLWLSPWTTWIGFRYLKSKKNSRFLSFITVMSMLGVGLGVAAMIIVLSIMDGFESEMKKRMMTSDLHILIQPTSSTPTFDNGYVDSSLLNAEQIESLKQASHGQIQEFWPVVATEAILKTGRKVTGVVLKGGSDKQIQQIQKHFVDPADEITASQSPAAKSLDLPKIWMGQELAMELGSVPGDQVTLISPTEMEGPLNAVPRFKKFLIAGIYHTGLVDQELHTLYSQEASVRSFLRRSKVVSQWEVTVKNFDEAPHVAEKIRLVAKQLRVQDWMQLNAHLFASLRLERFSMFIILAFIIVVASFNIVTTLTLMVLEKKKEISILKAMGAKSSQIAAIFLAEGVFIGGIGIGGGTLFGFVVCKMLKHYEFITLPDIYYDRTLPVTFEPRYYLGVGICALLIVMGACFYPSKRASQLNPLDGIRFG